MGRETCTNCHGQGIVGDMSKNIKCGICYGYGYVDVPDKSKKVICTELYRQNLLSHDDYVRGAHFSRKHLTERHERGYHFWAIYVVRKMRASSRWTKVWGKLAQSRANQLAYITGARSRPDFLGWILRTFGEPICWVIGGVIGEQKWRSLYKEDNTQSTS